MIDKTKIKKRIMEIGLKTGASHIASALSCVNVLCDTYDAVPDAIIILSKGHGALAQYVILNKIGKLPDEVLDSYYKDGGLSVHSTLKPEYGIYASTGSLGHGLAIGIGYALADKNRKVIVIMSDGELDEGSTLESLRIIQKLHIVNILPVVDQNDYTAFQEFDAYKMPFYRTYYSIKGEYWGQLEGVLASHYKTVDQELFNIFMKNVESSINTKSARSKQGQKNVKGRA